MYYRTTAKKAKEIFRNQIAEKKIPLTHELAWEHAMYSNDRTPQDVYREILQEFNMPFRRPFLQHR